MYGFFVKHKKTTNPDHKYYIRIIVADIEYKLGWKKQHEENPDENYIYFGLKFIMRDIEGCYNIKNLR